MKSIKFLIFILLFQAVSAAGLHGEEGAGSFIYFEGQVEILQAGEREWSAIDNETLAGEGDIIRTSRDSFARLEIEKRTIDIDSNSSFEISGADKDVSLDMHYGALRARAGELSGQDVSIRTPIAVASVRGTDFAVIYEQKDVSELEVYHGTIKFTVHPGETDFPAAEVGENLYALASSGSEPEIIGEITQIRELRWVHLEERMKSYRNLRRQREIEARLRRKRGLLRAAEDEEEAGRIREEIGRLRTEQASLERNMETIRERLEEISGRYSEIIEERARQKRILMEEKREEIFRRRLEEIERMREERRQRLEE